MRKKIFLITTLLFALLLTACTEDATPTPLVPTKAPATETSPTEVSTTTAALEEIPTEPPPTAPPPTAVPTQAAPTSPMDSMSHTANLLLTNKTWEWLRRDPNSNQMAEIMVSNPENYTLFFNDDSTFQAQLDCNNSNGRYATDNPGSIFMELGDTTLAFCGEDSLNNEMGMMFGPAQSYHFEENGSILVLAWVAGGPIDYFRNADAATVNPALIDKTWQWHGLTSSILDISIKTPEKYLIQFNEDGTVDLQADCNLIQATYTTIGSSININLKPGNTAVTLAVCPDGALYELYLLGLDTSQSYVLQGDTLALEMGENDGSMHFAETGTEAAAASESDSTSPVLQPPPETGDATGTVNAPDGINMREGPGTEYPAIGIIPDDTILAIVGVSQDREWWVIENPEQPDETAWVSRNFVEAENSSNVPTIATPELEPTLLDNPWQWHALTTPVETTNVSDPSLYTIQFKAGGTAVIRADCNTLTANYTTDENAINIDTGLTTLVACPGESLDALYLNTLTDVTTFFFEAGDLYMEMPADAGTMRFVPDKPPVPETLEEPDTPEEPPSTETEGDFFYIVSFGPTGSEQNIFTGTELTAVFTDNEVNGSAGCNDYTGTLDRTDDAFTVNNIVVTEKACSEPAGIMAQEQAYLTALASSGGFRWEERLADDGSKIITAGQLFYVANGTNGIINLISP